MTHVNSETVLQRVLDLITELPPDQAEAVASRMLRTDPASDTAHFAIGIAARRTGRLEVAIGSLRNAGRINRDSPLVARILGETFLHVDEPDLARIAFTACLERAPQDVEAGVGLAVCHATTGDTAEAKHILRRLLVASPEHPVASLYMGLILDAEGDPERALPWLESSVAANPGSAAAGLHLGRCRAELGDNKGAEEAFLAILSHSPDHREAQRNLDELCQAH
ncbi:MAG: tetratricopeptide (TPR) repeat protein [Myxococcota bacterium]|jgi:tetratricopeptide (TPR) repeat protein